MVEFLLLKAVNIGSPGSIPAESIISFPRSALPEDEERSSEASVGGAGAVGGAAQRQILRFMSLKVGCKQRTGE